MKMFRLILFLTVISGAPGKEKPNIVVIFIDDMGYGDIGPFGSQLNDTPHLDRMASEGRKLTSFYSAAPVCTSARAALMTGCYPRRVGLAKGSGHIVLFPGDPHGLNPEEWTMAEMFKSAGYATGCFGKWHLGDQPEFLPTAQGFDAYFGIPYSNDMWPALRRFQCPNLPVLRDAKVVDLVKTMDLLPTFEKMAKAPRRKNSLPIDGKDISEILLGRDRARSPHEYFFYHQADNLRAVRSGRWKCFQDGKLYDLESDIGEKRDVAQQHSEVVNRLQRAMKDFDVEMKAALRPVGFVKDSRTLVPRAGVEGEEACLPTLSLKRK
ncbi:MAG: sulfatase-like hydrolase/transferase [Roseibacillus sp.]|nr:sulfatase-like hydrolase/transferase [Roseibacillus sp.]